MLPTTLKLIRIAFESDPTLPVPDRRRLLALLRGGAQQPAPAPATAPATGEPRLLRRAEAARRLGCSIRLVDRLARDGTLPKRRLPGRRRSAGILESDLLTLLLAPLPATPAQAPEAA
jgi:predicted DNA-binding transcriptional regulator AlpA